MNIRRSIYIIIMVLAGLLPLASAAQSLPSLSKAPEISTGTLPNGISYYLVNNTASPGFADFALVQPLREDREGPRRDLASLPHFGSRKPYEFLADNGVGYGARGFIQHPRGASVFRFPDVPVALPGVTDSTLLMLFDIARSSEYGQAMVVSGNIDVSAIEERIRILSMTVSQRVGTDEAWAYGWSPQDEAVITVNTAPVGQIQLMYRSPRTERELMNTIQPLMSKMLAAELDIVLQKRLRAAFDDAGLALADYRFRYVGSDQTAGDELFVIIVYTDPSQMEAATATLAGVLSSLDADGATTEEVSFARSVISSTSARDDANYLMSNEEYLDKCISSYLYGSNLASRASQGAMFTGRRLDIDRETELLNRYISATVSPKRNLHMHFRAPVAPDRQKLADSFSKGWKDGSTALSDIPLQEDTLRLETPHKKVRLKNSSTDAFSGGKLWTFSNGFKVVYKKTSTKGVFQYGFMVKGGWAEIQGISGKESAFVEDVLKLERVSGMSGEHFRDLLAMNGISIDPQISLSDVRFAGSAPSSALPLLLKAMLSVANAAEADIPAYRRYAAEKAIRMQRDKFSESGTRAVLDSTMCPDYKYACGSLPDVPGEDFPLRLHDYLQQKGSTMRNGLIVLMGDLPEDATLKLLTHSLGDFRTNQQRIVRPREFYSLRDCWSTAYEKGSWRESGVNVSLSTPWTFGAEGNISMLLACTVLQNELVRELDAIGMRCSVNGVADLLPAEKLTIYVSCKPCQLSGLPADVVPASPFKALESVRAVINRLAVDGVDQATLARSKTMLTNSLAAQSLDPAKLRDAVLWRNSLGRDLTGGYKERIKTVSASEMHRLFRDLSECQCEYVVQ